MTSWFEIRQAMKLLVLKAIEAGWDQRAVQRLVTILFKKIQRISLVEALFAIQQAETKLYLVGSPLYQQLFRSSSYTPQQKLSLLLKQLGGTMDEYGFLQLQGSHSFDPQLAPHAPFLHTLAKTVQRSYPQGLLAASDQETAKKIHQLRMYFDRQSIYYIRTNFKYRGITDEAALRNYVFAPSPTGLAGQKLKREPARLHNKYRKGTVYQNRSLNKKRLSPHFHSEFILDPEGNFVSQWDILKEYQNGKIISDPVYYQKLQPYNYQQKLMNGESFNYANRNNQQHELLDSAPPSRFDHDLRKMIKTNWRSPQVKEYDYQQDKQLFVDDYSS
jgi:hypothetical protein